jgi:hypothetical protein
MIIGVSGKIGSGKDTLGKIIQYLTTPENNATNIAEYFSNKWKAEKSSWQIVKFADTLKDIVCILTGCTREQLEDIDFKNSKLPIEWNNGWANMFDDKALPKKHLTYRQLLQYLGTDLLRNQLHENVWVNALMSKYKLTPDPSIRITNTSHPSISVKESFKVMYPDNHIFPNWIITDMRFPNEAKAVKDRDGITIRVNRPNINKLIDSGIDVRNINTHPSETTLDDYLFDYCIDNNGTIEDLINKVKLILIKEKVI